MIKLQFNNNGTKKEFVLDKYKCVKVNNNKDYWSFILPIKYSLGSAQTSEFRKENNCKINISIDDEPICKNDEIFLINHNFDLDSDTKMGQKSLCLRYLCKKIDEMIFDIDFLQLKSLLNMIMANITSNNLIYREMELNGKNLSKLADALAIKNTTIIDKYDMDYEETIIFQLDIIIKILDNTKRTIIFIELVELSESIYNKILQMNENCYVVILFITSKICLDVNNIYVDGIDFEDDQKLYERMETMTNYYDLGEYKKILKIEHLNIK